jgi:hypothetical protein
MARYATGKKSKAISDISGFKVDYTELKTTYDNLRVEPSEFDPKHPQLTPAKNVIDATALFQPRPDNDPENVSFFVGFNTDIFASKIQNAQKGIGVKGLASIGTFTIRLDHSQDVTGVSGTGALGTLNFKSILIETGVAGTGGIGTAVPTGIQNVTGVSGTGAIGGFGVTDGASIKLTISETGLAGTGAIGTEVPTVSLTETGLAGTGAIGSVSITISELGWSGGDWGESTWGQ